MAKYSEEDVRRLSKELGVHFIRLQFTDILGILKSVDIPIQQLDKALAGELMFDGSSIEGFVRIEESDMYLRPDPDTFAVFPWKEKEGVTARLICDIYNPDGTPFEGCTRSALKRVLAEAEEQGYTFNVGPEPEFFLFLRDEKGRPTTDTLDSASYFDMAPVDKGEAARAAIATTLQAMGFEVEASHHEVAPAQHEIDFKYEEALTTADNIATFRVAVRVIAAQHGLHATFMPKPLFGVNGSGMHLHMSLFGGGENAFFDPNGRDHVSQVMMHFIGGLMKHARAFTAVTNPLVNSYKRLVPGYEAPVYIAWSHRNRSPLIRIPAKRGASTRLELRSPDPSCNPYLALAVTLKAGLDGIKNRVNPPAAVDRNIYQMTARERAEGGIDSLPGSLIQAIEELKKNKVIQSALGEHIYYRFLEAKQLEWDIYRTQIHQWETDQYLATF